MKISLADLSRSNEPYYLELLGNEPWLEELYKEFKDVSSKVTGYLNIELLENEFLLISGEISFVPKVDCSRCGDPKDWPLKESVSRQIPIEQKVHPKEFEASAMDMKEDEFFLQNNELDLLNLIQETVFLALPLQNLRLDESGEKCLDCDEFVSTPVMYSTSTNDLLNNPFAKLNDLKL